MTDLTNGDYPKTWDDFIGQEQAKRKLLVASRSAKLRGAPMDPVLIQSGKAGVGKTALAWLAAQELGTQIHPISGKVKINEARILFSRVKPFDVIFYDEIHQAAGKDGEWLLTALQDGVLPGPGGRHAKLPPVSWIAATTDAGRLRETVLSRFSPLRLVDYTHDEAMRVVLSLSTRVFPKELPLPSRETADRIAGACNRNPRIIRQLLINVRDIALAMEMSIVNVETGDYELDEAMSWMGLHDDGLTEQARHYLEVMVSEFQGQPVGEKTMADRLNEPGGLAAVERLLLDKGFIAKTRQGREITSAGIQRVSDTLINAA